jgi:hypothetical protein
MLSRASPMLGNVVSYPREKGDIEGSLVGTQEVTKPGFHGEMLNC